jgi:3-methyladenine DNA glycosylase AlkD
MLKTVQSIREILKASVDSSPEKATRFFKTNPGAYAAFDQFLGITVPTLRSIAKKFAELPLEDLEDFLRSPFNEERLFALIILGHQYQKGELLEKKRVYEFYLKNIAGVNNWNLVDNSAHLIMGAHLWDKDRAVLLTLAQSKDLWERRISIVATWYFIKRQDFKDTLTLSTLFMNDSHDLMHKACGWMLREVGKQNIDVLLKFLNQNHQKMPRTMLRYAIERLPEDRRKGYLLKK